MGTFHEDVRSLVIVSPLNLLIARNISDKSFRDIQVTHFIFNSPPPRISCHLWDNVEKCGTGRQATYDSIIRRMRLHAGYLRLQTHSEYVIYVVYPQQ